VKKARLIRGPTSLEGTFGVLVFGREWTYTTELPWLNNIRRVSCIPVGEYVCRIVNSPRFGRVYKVFGVPDRDAILFHPANLAGSERHGWTTQLQGCIAPSLKRGKMRNKAGKMQSAGLVSGPAVRKLMDWGGGDPFTLTIENENGH
jgi:hypothetical protein